jgi:hypothetical protein
MYEKASHTAMNGGAGAAVVSGSYSGVEYVLGLTPSQWSVIGVIGGLLIGVIGLGFNTYFQWKRSGRDID